MKKPAVIETLSKSVGYAYKPILTNIAIDQIMLYIAFLESEVEGLKRDTLREQGEGK